MLSWSIYIITQLWYNLTMAAGEGRKGIFVCLVVEGSPAAMAGIRSANKRTYENRKGIFVCLVVEGCPAAMTGIRSANKITDVNKYRTARPGRGCSR